MKRQATAEWKGTLQEGTGKLGTDSRVLADTPYSFRSRFAEGKETNPEELVAAAHAGCFAMALSGQLGEAGLTAESLRVKATVSLDKGETGWAVTASHLELEARIPGASPEAFDKAAQAAKAGCPISKLLMATITLDAKLLSGAAR